jgi:hypothetical protein
MTDADAAAVKRVRAYAVDVESFHRHASQRDVAALLRAYDAVVKERDDALKRRDRLDTMLGQAITKLATLRAQHAALVALLRRVEWSPTMGIGEPACPSCGGSQYGGGHKSDCLLLATLSGVETP